MQRRMANNTVDLPKRPGCNSHHLDPLDRCRRNSQGFGAEAEERRCVPGDNVTATENTVAVATVQECGFERPPCSAVWHPPTAACPQDKRPRRALSLHPRITSLSPDCSKRRFQQAYVKRLYIFQHLFVERMKESK